MTKLSDTQLVVLTAACERDDGNIFPTTAKVTGGALKKVLASLLGKGLLEELPSMSPGASWRTGEDGARLTLRASPAAYVALGIEPPETTGGEQTPDGGGTEVDIGAQARKQAPGGKKARRRPGSRTKAAGADAGADAGQSRTGTKQAELIAMLRRPDGASIDEIIATTSWQPHTVRGAISGVLKTRLGLAVNSEKIEGRGRVYRIAG